MPRSWLAVSHARRAPDWPSTSARRSRGFGSSVCPGGKLGFEPASVDRNENPVCYPDLAGRARKQTPRECDGARERKADLVRQPAHQSDMFKAALADTACHPLSRRIDAWELEVGEQVVDPFLVDIRDKCSYFNVV